MGNKHMEKCSIPLYNIVKLKNKIKEFFKKEKKFNISLKKKMQIKPQ